MPDSPKSSPFKNYLRSVFNFRAWADWSRFRNTSNYFLTIFRRIFLIRPIDASQIKSFDDVMTGLGLTEETLKKQEKGLRNQWILMLFLAASFYIYAMYQLLYGGFLSVVLSLIVMFVALALAFRYHFWCFQIRRRKLGCSLTEWFNATFVKGGEV